MFLQSLGLDYLQKIQVSWWNIGNLRNVPKKPPRDCQSWNTSRWPPEGSTCCRQCKVGLEGESLLMCWLEGFWKKDETYGMRCMKIYLTREQQHGCHWLFKCFYICRKYIQRLGIYAMILMEHPLRKPRRNAETSKSTHAHSWIFSKTTASSGPTVTSHKHLKMFQLVCLPCFTNWCCNCKWKNQVQIQAENSKSNLTVWRIWLPEILHLLVTQRILDALSLHLIPLGDVFMLNLLRLDGVMTHDLTKKIQEIYAHI